MKITITSPNIEVTKAVNDYIEKKAKAFERPLKKYFDDKEDEARIGREEIECFWEIGTESTGLRRGAFFSKVRIVGGGKFKDVISSTRGRTLFNSVDKAKDMVLEQLVEKRKKPMSVKKREARKFKRNLNIADEAKMKEGERVLEEGN